MTAADRATLAAGAAPARQRVLAQAAFEARTLLRNGEQLLVALLLPAAALVGLALSSVPDLGPGRRIDLAVPGVLGLAVVSTAFTGQAIATAFDRRYGVLQLLGTTPLGRTGLVAGKAVAVLTVELIQVLVLAALGVGLGWRPDWSGVPAALLTLVLGTWTFVALALLLAGTVRAEGVLALANVIWVALLGLGGLVVAASEVPSALEPFVRLLPSAALGDGLRTALVDGAADPRAWVVMVAWGSLATALAARAFRWSD